MTPLRFAVLGNPIAHSKSPDMHNAGYRALRLPHTYDAVQTDAAGLPGLIGAMKRRVFSGYNVTLPHKTTVLQFADVIEPSAALVGAANTIKLGDDGRIYAINTDWPAIADELRGLAPQLSVADWAASTALVIGSGGAARSAIAALASSLGVQRIVLRNRPDASGSMAKLQQFADEITASFRAAGVYTTLVVEPLVPSDQDASFTAIVQTTSAELHGDGANVAACVNWAVLPVAAVALDVVYAPAETAFLRAARESGIRCVNGVGMLARQGALAFEYWLGQAAPYNAMLAALV
jgi:shikimate dehydrogenase